MRVPRQVTGQWLPRIFFGHLALSPGRKWRHLVQSLATHLDIAGLEVPPGTRRDGWISLGHRPDGTRLAIPVTVVRGIAPGPRLALIAGVHGDEFENCEGIRRFLNGIDPAGLRGTIVATPQANPNAFEAHSRHSAVDHLDLNRSFPGDEAGFVTQRVAAAITKHLVEGADYLLDMHSGGMVLDLAPFVGFDATPGSIGERSFALAKSTGLEVLYGSTPFSNVLRLEAARRGIPAILVEIGAQGRLVEELVDLSCAVLASVTGYLDMWDCDGRTAPRDDYLVLKAPASGEFMHASTGGFLTHRVRLGQVVQLGDLLGVVTDPFGNELDRIVAPNGGFIAEMRCIPVVHTGDWTYAVLPVVDTIAVDATLDTLGAF
jgi:predicted deacylase